MQQVLARIYTDAAFRTEFLADPTRVGLASGLSAQEVTHLASVSANEIRRFAHSLHRKRADEVRGLLPCTSKALGNKFNRLFANHANRFCPCGIGKHRDDAIAFALSLFSKSCCERIPAAILDLARYETAHLEVCPSGARMFLRVFRHDVRQLIGQMQEGVHPVNAPVRRAVGIWMRFGSAVRLYYAVVPTL
jgi:hypothetical protein